LWGALPPPAPLARECRPFLLAVLAVAFALRLGVAWRLPNIHQADEVYQVAEQANRAVHGYGVVSWEFRTAARGALFAVAAKPIYALDVSPAVHQMLLAAFFAALSLIPVWVAFRWTAALYRGPAGILAGLMTATWFELVYFAPKPTPDAVAGYFLVAAIFLMRPGTRGGALFAAGVCLLLTATIRMQIAPAVALLLGLAMFVHDRRGIAWLLAGGLAAVIVVGLAEWSWWGVPFLGHWNYLVNEFVHGASGYFKREPITYYLKTYILLYGAAVPIVALLVYMGARRAPILFLVALAVVAPFHVFAHKEYRFLITAAPLVVLLISIGIAELLTATDANVLRPKGALVLAGWLASMLAISAGDQFRPNWFQDRNHIFAFRDVGSQPDACGVLLVAVRWWHTPGYSGMGRDVPIYESGREEDESVKLLPAANYLLAGTKVPPPPAPWVRWRAYTRPEEFLYRRPGACVRDEGAIVQPAGIPGVGQ
jgi:phosphatidylinositol glycan class B